MYWFRKFIFGIKLYMFPAVPLSIIRSFSLYTQQWYMCWQLASRIRTELRPDPTRKLSAHIPLLCVQWKTHDDGQKNCLKHVAFYSKNKFEKLVHLVGFIVRKYSDDRGQILSSRAACWPALIEKVGEVPRHIVERHKTHFAVQTLSLNNFK